MPTTSEDRIDRLETRVDRIENKIGADISKIFEKIDALSATVMQAAVDSAKHACPAPGSCVGLNDQLKHVIEAHNATMLRVERLELKMLDMDRETLKSLHRIDGQFANLEKQKAWILGVWSAIAFFAAIVGTVLTIMVGHFIDKI